MSHVVRSSLESYEKVAEDPVCSRSISFIKNWVITIVAALAYSCFACSAGSMVVRYYIDPITGRIFVEGQKESNG